MRIWKNAYAGKSSKAAPPDSVNFQKRHPPPKKSPPPGVSRNLFLTVRALFSAASARRSRPFFRGLGALRLSATIITYFLSENNPLSENCFRRKKNFCNFA